MKVEPHKSARPKVLLALDYYDYRIHRGVARVAAQMGWSLICTQSAKGVSTVPEDWSGQGVVSLMSIPKTIHALSSLSVPIVDIGLSPLPFSVSRIVTDNEAIGTAAAEHFLHKGLRSFLLPEVEDNNRMFSERRHSYLQTLHRFPKKLQIKNSAKSASRQKWEEILAECPKPLAIFGYVDGHALTILDIVLELGYRIPEDIAILGVDNNDLACEGVDVPISSVESDQEGLGEKAAQLLAQKMSGAPIETEIIRHPIKGVITRKSSDTLASSHPKIQQALAIILSQFQTGINALELAKRMDMTPQGLQHIFKEHDGRSPGEVLRMVRLQHAKELLLDHDYKLQDISNRCGYASVDAFCRVFRQNLHSTPTHWRKSRQN